MSYFYKAIEEGKVKSTDVSISQLKAMVELFKEIGVDFIDKNHKFTIEEFVSGMADELEEHGDDAGKNDTIPNVNGHDNPVKGGKTALVHLIKSPLYYTKLKKMEKGLGVKD